MRAAQFDRYGKADVLRVRDVPVPVPGTGQVLVRVGATTVNWHDVVLRAGKTRLVAGRRFPKGTGSDFAGEVVGLGVDATGYSVGDRVWGFLPGLSHPSAAAAAEYLAIDESRISLSPAGLDDVAAASLIAGGTVAIVAFRDKAKLARGERVLVRGATGGVGSIAVQYAHAHGAHVTALASAKNLDLAASLGADHPLDYGTTRPSELGTFDVIFDAVGTQPARFRRHLARGGRMVSITVGSVPAAAYMLASNAFGSRRVRFFSGNPKQDLFADLTREVNDGHVFPVVDTVFPLESIAEAHRSMKAGGGKGKLVVRLR